MQNKLFAVRSNPTQGFDIVGVSTDGSQTESVIIQSVSSEVDIANEVTAALNETARHIEHTWQHVVESILEPVVTNWDAHIPPVLALKRGMSTTIALNNQMAKMVEWLKLWLGSAESSINAAKLTDDMVYRLGEGSRPNITVGQIREMIRFLDQAPDEDKQMAVGSTYRHADGGLYELVAIDVDHKGEDSVWRPGVLYRPVMNGITGDTRMKTTTVERWRERFVFAG